MGKKVLILSILTIFLPFFVHADEMDTLCQQLSVSQGSCQNVSSADCQKQLQQCANYYDAQSAQIAKDITKTSAQKNTLQSQISSLRSKISGLEAQIKQGTVLVKDLNLKISDTQTSIDKTEQSISDSQAQIVEILREVEAQDNTPAFVILTQGNLSDFFGNVARLETLNARISDLLESNSNLKDYLQGQVQKQNTEKTQLQNTIKVQSLQKQQNEQNKKQQDSLLKLTEAQYQQQVKDKQTTDQKASAIKSRIFDLLGVSSAPTFGEAYNIAKYVEGATGVRAALTLAILTQESNLGKNVGQCYLKNTSTGDGVKIKTGAFAPKTMHPTRDVPPFLQLIQEINAGKNLYRDPMATPVSCVIYVNGRPSGWGGAMGPSQFIPSTWVTLGYGKKVSSVTGKSADPWDIRDAFLATGFLLKDNGALKSEFNAAMKYYCGGACSRYDRFYGNSVVNIANGYEDDIKAIGG